MNVDTYQDVRLEGFKTVIRKAAGYAGMTVGGHGPVPQVRGAALENRVLNAQYNANYVAPWEQPVRPNPITILRQGMAAAVAENANRWSTGSGLLLRPRPDSAAVTALTAARAAARPFMFDGPSNLPPWARLAVPRVAPATPPGFRDPNVSPRVDVITPPAPPPQPSSVSQGLPGSSMEHPGVPLDTENEIPPPAGAIPWPLILGGVAVLLLMSGGKKKRGRR